MRVPLAKVWRAFPELDPFADAECQRYVKEATRRRLLSAVVLMSSGLLIALMLGVACTWAVIATARWSGVTTSGIHRWTYQVLLEDVPKFAIVPVSLWVGVLLGRDLWLRRAIRKRLDLTICGGCGYSLLGLTLRRDPGTDDEYVMCPECAQRISLRGIGATRDDFLADGHRDPGPKPPPVRTTP